MSTTRLEVEENKAKIREIMNEITVWQKKVQFLHDMLGISASMSDSTKALLSRSATRATLLRGQGKTESIKKKESNSYTACRDILDKLQQLYGELSQLGEKQKRLTEELHNQERRDRMERSWK